MNDAARLHAARLALPQLLNAARVHHRIAPGGQVEFLDRLLCERSARALGKNRHLGEQVWPRLVVRFRLPVMIDALVADAHADHVAVVRPEQLLTRKGGEDVGAAFFGDPAEPLGESLQARDVLAVIFHHRRHREAGHGHLPAVGEIPHLIARNRGLDRCGLAPPRQQLVEAFGIDDGAGDAVSADVGAFLDKHDGKVVLAALLRKPSQLDRGREPGGPAADDQDVDFELIAFCHMVAIFPGRPAISCPRLIRRLRATQRVPRAPRRPRSDASRCDRPKRTCAESRA